MDIYPKVKEAFKGYKITEITKEIAEMWKKLTPSEKEYYEIEAVKQK